MVSAVLATPLAIEFGFRAVLALAPALYVLAAVVCRGGIGRVCYGDGGGVEV